MIRRIQALNYRCLRFVDVALDRFHVLVGPNASGKSTLFDVVDFLGDLVSDGLEAAVGRRSRDFRDLVWERGGPGFELAAEFDVPERMQARFPGERRYGTFRYEVSVAETDGQARIESERGILMPAPEAAAAQGRSLFPDPLPAPDTIMLGGGRRGSRTVLSKNREGKDNFHTETSERPGKGWVVNISFGPQRSTLQNLPESPDMFPAATHVKRTLERRVKPLFLDSVDMRRASPPRPGSNGFAPDGSNLPWAVKRMKEDRPDAYADWLAHIRTVLADLEDVRIVERPDDRHAYLTLRYGTGVEVPSWMASDGTLRLLALTLLAYLPEEGEIYLLEEPENGIHPMAVDCVYQSLASVYDSQLLLATHSPVVLKLAELQEVLCFAKDEDGATDIVRGNDHPRMRGWRGSAPDMDLLLVRGVFG